MITKTILITGATGFIGQHLLEELVGENTFKVRITSRKSTLKLWTTNTNYELFTGDISDDAFVEKALLGVDIIVNLAAELKDQQKFSLNLQ